MCKHSSAECYCFSDRWYYNNPANLCNNSRAQGCKGCFCRYPIPTKNGECKKCGREFYELMDLIFDIRRKIYIVDYNYYDDDIAFELDDNECYAFVQIEEVIYNRVWNHVEKEKENNQSKNPVSRTKCLTYFKKITSEITEDVIDLIFKYTIEQRVAYFRGTKPPLPLFDIAETYWQ